MSTSPLLHEPLAQVFEHSAIPALRKLFVEETPTAVEISGCVSSYYYKQLAQETVRPVLGPRMLFNRVTVLRKDPAQSQE
jgi:hypothetical protein